MSELHAVPAGQPVDVDLLEQNDASVSDMSELHAVPAGQPVRFAVSTDLGTDHAGHTKRLRTQQKVEEATLLMVRTQAH